MRNFRRTTAGKVLAFILCIVFLGCALLSALGAVLLADRDFYTQPKNYLHQRQMESLFIRDSYSIIDNALYPANRPDSTYSPENTNLRFAVYDFEGNCLLTNLDTPLGQPDSRWVYRITFRQNTPKENFGRYLSCEGLYAGQESMADYEVCGYLEQSLPVSDSYSLFSGLIRWGYALRYWIFALGIAFAVLSFACFIDLLCVSARIPHSQELRPGPLNGVPTDILFAGAAWVLFMALLFIKEGFHTGSIEDIILSVLWALAAVCTGLGLCMSAAARIKEGSFLSNTLLWRVYRFVTKCVKRLWKFLCRIVTALPLVWRTAGGVLILTVTDFFLLAFAAGSRGGALALWFFFHLFLGLAAVYIAWMLRRLQKAGRALASGDYTAQIDPTGLVWDFRDHARDLNSIGSGMSKALEQRLQSQRMKTELITNVSHDIKNPLTSIINYAQLIGQQSCDCPEHGQYSDVLQRKSQHLKRLLEDLVEISKADSGNLEVDLQRCDAGVLVNQLSGEFQQRCEAASLQLITRQPEEAVYILADSRRIWRVFENLMGNACKYSLPGSRVYLSLEKTEKSACFTFCNTSREPLNISPIELMERFVRGDASRSTEGNGLGLSIAQSLTQLQGGTMDISIEADLFKVTLNFPLA